MLRLGEQTPSGGYGLRGHEKVSKKVQGLTHNLRGDHGLHPTPLFPPPLPPLPFASSNFGLTLPLFPFFFSLRPYFT